MPRYMTQEGVAAIQTEIDFMWRTERPEVVASVSAAAEMGDRSENAAYIYGKKRLHAIDGRLRYLRRKIDGVTVVDLDDQPQFEDVRFGAVVTVEDEHGETREWRLVDKEESDVQRHRISVQSPVGSALLGRRAGDCVEIKLPRGTVEYEIISVRYGAGAP